MLEYSEDTERSAEQKKREFEQLAFVLMDSLFNTAMRMTRNELDAEDLVQDVYVRAFRFFHKFKRDTNFKAWIFKILTNTYINQYRKKKIQPHQVELDKVPCGQNDETRVTNQETDAEAIRNLDHYNYHALFDDEIFTALDRLSDEFRLVVMLADVESFSYKEIAVIMGCPVGTVMSRLSRGRKQLQSLLREYALKEGFINKSNQQVQ